MKVLQENEGKSADTSGSSNVDLAGVSENSQIAKYAPAVVGLLAANLLILLAVLVFSILNFVRRGKSGNGMRMPERQQQSHYTKLHDEEASTSHYPYNP